MNLLVLTHHKCGSNWFRRLFARAAEAAGLNVEVPRPTHWLATLDRGADRTVHFLRGGYLEIPSGLLTDSTRTVHCVRDPRDAFVSQYWSWKISHKQNTPTISAARQKLNSLSLEGGLSWLLESDSFPYAKQLESWRNIAWPNRHLIRYERLLESFHSEFGAALAHLGIALPAEVVDGIRSDCSFEALTGRHRGEEDVTRHLRKAVAGDWRNYFDEQLLAAFDARYGWMYERLGYAAEAVTHSAGIPSAIADLRATAVAPSLT